VERLAEIYLVDDHVILREALVSLLAAHGHVVVGQSQDPGHAVTEIRRLRPDILLVDLALGLRSGFELLSELKRRAMHFKTIVMTTSALPRDVAEALRSGADGYVLKSAGGDELMRAIDSVLKGRRHYEGQVAELALQGLTRRDDDAVLASLSARERQVIVMVANGQSSTEIGADLNLSAKTVDTYRSRLMAKVGAGGIVELVRFALRCGLISAREL
jgi:two-component system, NarL family, invasion response regulator UvrY